MRPTLRTARRKAGRSSSLALALLAALPPAGCTGDPARTAEVLVVDSAGIPVATSPAERLDVPLGWSVAPDPYLRIGTLEGDEEIEFQAISAVARLSDGRLFVSEGGERRLRLFDGEGNFLRWVGDLGEGPAEYGRVGNVGVLEGDTLWAWDSGRRRVVLFTPDGEYARGFVPEPPEGVTTPRTVALAGDGRVVHQGTDFTPADIPESGPFRETVLVSVLDAEGMEATPVADAPGAAYVFTEMSTADGGTAVGLTTADPVFHAPIRFVSGTDRVVRADPSGFELRELSLEGDLLRIVRVERPPRPVASEVARGYEAAWAEAVGAEQLQRIRQMRGGIEYAEHLPHFGRILLDDDGGTWLGEFEPVYGGEEPTRWWRIGAHGGLEGHLDVPEGFRLLAVEGDLVLGAERDEWDVPYLVAYGIERGDGSVDR